MWNEHKAAIKPKTESDGIFFEIGTATNKSAACVGRKSASYKIAGDKSVKEKLRAVRRDMFASIQQPSQPAVM